MQSRDWYTKHEETIIYTVTAWSVVYKKQWCDKKSKKLKKNNVNHYLSHHLLSSLLGAVSQRSKNNASWLPISQASSILGGTSRLWRHKGQVVCPYESHVSKQFLWKRWSHLNSLISSSSSILLKQMAHSTSSFSSAPPLYDIQSNFSGRWNIRWWNKTWLIKKSIARIKWLTYDRM